MNCCGCLLSCLDQINVPGAADPTLAQLSEEKQTELAAFRKMIHVGFFPPSSLSPSCNSVVGVGFVAVIPFSVPGAHRVDAKAAGIP